MLGYMHDHVDNSSTLRLVNFVYYKKLLSSVSVIWSTPIPTMIQQTKRILLTKTPLLDDLHVHIHKVLN